MTIFTIPYTFIIPSYTEVKFPYKKDKKFSVFLFLNNNLNANFQFFIASSEVRRELKIDCFFFKFDPLNKEKDVWILIKIMPEVHENLGENINICLNNKIEHLNKTVLINKSTLFKNTNKNNSLKKKKIIFNLESSFIKKNKITKKDLKSGWFGSDFLQNQNTKTLKWSTSKSKLLLKKFKKGNLKTDGINKVFSGWNSWKRH